MITLVKLKRVGFFATLVFVVAGCGFGPARAQTDRKSEIADMDDREIVRLLSADNKEESFSAAREIFKRGEKMIPLLMENKGNQAPFAWGSLGNPNSGGITFAPSGNTEWDEGRTVSVEVASIYLICAIYKQDFEFGQSAYLRSNEDVSFNKYNTSERVAEAWSAIENWITRMNSEGLANLRKQKIHPLINTKFYF